MFQYDDDVVSQTAPQKDVTVHKYISVTHRNLHLGDVFSMYAVSRAGSNYKKSNQLQLLSISQFNYNYTSTIFKSVIITPFQFQLQLHLYYAEPFVNYVACVLLIACTNYTIDKQI